MNLHHFLIFAGGRGDQYTGNGRRVMGGKMPEATPDDHVDEYGRVTKGPYTLRNGATYTG